MTAKNELSEHEKSVLEFWEKENINSNVSKLGTKQFRFIDGPPFVSGKLHTGSLSVGFIKDVVLRFFRMHDYHCQNKIGFDCHGLPSENMVMKLLSLFSKKDIEQFGVGNFIDACINTINEYSLSWKPSYDKIGRIIDFNNQYKTIDKPFMETVWWIFKQMYEKNLIYKAFKVMPHSYACETPLSNFEATQNYKDVCTNTVYVKFQIKNQPNTYFCAWTTTPWTLPSNVALCVGPNIKYVKCKTNTDEILVVAENCVPNLQKENISIISTELFGSGSELKGLEYIPLFNFLQFKYHKVLVDDYVKEQNDGVGTGIVHISAVHGEDDCRVCLENNVIKAEDLNQVCLVNDQGKFVSGTDFLEGELVFDANKKVIKYLEEKGYLFKTQMYTHSYPHCYRSETPLIYKITSSYFVAVSQIRDKLVEMNEKINWSNPSIGIKFKNWLESARDWCLSRNRYFGTPIPVWESEDGTERVVIGSIQELVELAKLQVPPPDLHINHIKDITITSQSGKILKVCGDSLDCWFESGSVPYGQYHYPFENSNVFDDKDYLCDFIAEGLDQTRGWFYTLLVISTIISNKPAFKNVICSGLVLGKDGKKESKKNGNFVDPDERISKFGADAIRIYLVSSPLVNGDGVKFFDEKVERMGNELVHLQNVAKFYFEQRKCLKEKEKPNQKKVCVKYLVSKDTFTLTNPTDLWILSKLSALKENVEKYMFDFHIERPSALMIDFIEDIANWYLKLNRDRLKGKDENNNQQEISLSVLFTVLYDYTLMLAPFAPFMSESIYKQLITDFTTNENNENIDLESFKNLQFEKSVHMCKYPNITRYWTNDAQSFENLKEIVLALRQIRGQSKSHSSQRVPIKICKIFHQKQEYLENTKKLISLVEEEINSLGFEYSIITKDLMMLKPSINFKAIGLKYKNDSAKIKKLIDNLTQEELSLFQEIGSITINTNGENIVLTKDLFDVKVSLNFDSNANLAVYSNKDLILTADLTLNQEVNDTNHCRNLISTIQQFRKKIGLKPWNKIYLEYDGCESFMTKYKSDFEIKLGCSVEKHSGKMTEYIQKYVYSDLQGFKSDVVIYLFILE
jgi:isoleucyl-tRNA synthetase